MSKKLIVSIVVLAIVVIGLVAYISLDNQSRSDFRRPPFENMPNNLSLTDEVKFSTVEFFEGSPSLEDAEAYCIENKMNCFYYCAEVNSEHEICDKIMMPNNNFSGRGFRR